MKKILTWFKPIEFRLFGDKVESNDYFATVSIMFAAFTGALIGVSDFLYNWEIFDSRIYPFAVYAFAVILMSLNIGESIMAADTVKTACLRSLLIIVAISLAVAAGYIAAVVVAIVILLWIVLMAISIALGGGSSRSGRRRGRLDDGTEVEETGSGLLGEKYYTSTDGSREFKGHAGSDNVTEI